jgi:hypothetical protein
MFSSSSLNLRRTDRLMLRDSERALVYVACQCTFGVKQPNPSANRGAVNCPFCKAFGWIFADPIDILVTISGYKDALDPSDIAVFAAGDLVMSLRPYEKITISRGDRVVLPRLDGGMPFPGEIIQHTQNAFDLATWPIVRVTACSVVRESGPVFFQAGVDFTTSGDTITWQAGRLQLDEVYFLKYDAQYDYVADPSLYARYDRGAPLGQKVFLRQRGVNMKLNNQTDPLFKQQ